MRTEPIADARNEAKWHALYRRWFHRVLARAGWKLSIVGDPHLDSMAEYSVVVPRRELVLKFRTDVAPDPKIAAHEIGHVMVAHVQVWADHIIEQLPAAVQDLARRGIKDALEEAAEDIGMALVEAYKETDAGGQAHSAGSGQGGRGNVKAGRAIRK
jgi:hypothetical protein